MGGDSLKIKGSLIGTERRNPNRRMDLGRVGREPPGKVICSISGVSGGGNLADLCYCAKKRKGHIRTGKM